MEIKPSTCVRTARIENGTSIVDTKPAPIDLKMISPCLLVVSSSVCLKETDQTVSWQIAVEGSWEREEVGFVIRAMRAYSDAVFVGRK